jgi:hypothetical protein
MPACCFRDLASFSNRQKRLQQNRRYAVEIQNDDYKGVTETAAGLRLGGSPTGVLRANFFTFVYYYD